MNIVEGAVLSSDVVDVLVVEHDLEDWLLENETFVEDQINVVVHEPVDLKDGVNALDGVGIREQKTMQIL